MDINELELRLLGGTKQFPLVFVFSNSILNELEFADIWCIRHFKLWNQHPWITLSSCNQDSEISKFPNWGINNINLDDFIELQNVGEIDFLVSNKNQSNRVSLINQSEISIFEASLLIRSIFKLSGYYIKQNHIKAGLTSFYNDSIDTEVLRFRNLWKTTINLELQKKNSSLYEQILSLYQRISTFFRSTDYVGSLSILNSNNFINDELLYHFGYMILLAYGIFEDFAWIVNYSENLALENKKIGIRNHNDFKILNETLRNNHADFHSHIFKSDNQSMIELIFMIRSYLVHKSYLTNLSFSSFTENGSKTQLKLSIKKENMEFFQNNSERGYFSNSLYLDDSGFLHIDPFSFTSQLFYQLTIFIEKYSYSMMNFITNRYGA